jgi:hypothetical protein
MTTLNGTSVKNGGRPANMPAGGFAFRRGYQAKWAKALFASAMR